jgi:hypothetical protein
MMLLTWLSPLCAKLIPSDRWTDAGSTNAKLLDDGVADTLVLTLKKQKRLSNPL